MQRTSRQLILTFLISLLLFLLWTFTRLQDFQMPSPWSTIKLDGRCYIVTTFAFISFIIIFYKNIQTNFKDPGSLKLLIVGGLLLLFWLLAFYWLRLVVITFGLALMGNGTTIWDFTLADLIVYIPILAPIGLIIYVSLRLRRLKNN